MGGRVSYWSNSGGKNRAAGNATGEIRIVRIRPLDHETWFWRTPIDVRPSLPVECGCQALVTR